MELRDYGNLIVIQGDRESLVVEAPVDLLANISSEVRGDTLILEIGRDWLERRLRLLLLSSLPSPFQL